MRPLWSDSRLASHCYHNHCKRSGYLPAHHKTKTRKLENQVVCLVTCSGRFWCRPTHFPYFFACKIHEMCGHHFRGIARAIKLFVLCASIHAHSLCVLTLDRYLAIVKPMRYVTFMTTKRVALLISAAWGVASFEVLIPCLTLHLATSGKSRNIINGYPWVFPAIPNTIACVLLLFATTRIVHFVFI